MDPDLRRMLSASKMRLRAKSPYFSVLVSYLKPHQVAEGSNIETAATNGTYLYINKRFWLSMKPLEQDFVLVHEVLHAALHHCTRHMGRHPVKWNVACDYVVNLIAKAAGFQPPVKVLLDEKYEKMTAEEVYALLPDCESAYYLSGDVLPSDGAEGSEADKTWRAAKAHAKAASKMFGSDPAGDPLSVELEKSTIDWRHILWRDLTIESADFAEWDRRLVADETFVESLEPEERPSPAAICVDTSGSTMEVLGKFCGEVAAIASLYGGKGIDLYFADAALIGPLNVSEITKPLGGGGTSFVPFFQEVEKRKYKRAVYLTDLDGSYPEKPPSCDVLWVVPPGVRETVPFGRVVKILD